MTTILYRNGEFITDTSGAYKAPGSNQISHIKIIKSMITSDKKMVIGYTGDAVDFNNKTFKNQVSLFKAALNTGAWAINPPQIIRSKLHDCYEECIFFVMTRERFYVAIKVEADSENGFFDIELTPVDPKLPYANGMTVDLTELICENWPDLTNIEVLRRVFKRFPESYNCELTRWTQSDLVPFATPPRTRAKKQKE